MIFVLGAVTAVSSFFYLPSGGWGWGLCNLPDGRDWHEKNWVLLWWAGLCSVQFSRSVVSDSLWPHDGSTPGLPIHQQQPEFTQTHVYWVSDAIQASHPLLSPSPPAFNLSQHQGLFPKSRFFASRGQSIGVSASASVLPMNIQDWFPLGLTGLISFLSKELKVFLNTTFFQCVRMIIKSL